MPRCGDASIYALMDKLIPIPNEILKFGALLPSIPSGMCPPSRGCPSVGGSCVVRSIAKMTQVFHNPSHSGKGSSE
jgi:hypothetical protein